MPNVYERARADGSPDWRGKTRDWESFAAEIYDQLRFHRGDGFVITDRHDNTHGPKRPLREIPDALHKQLNDSPELNVFEVEAQSDQWKLIVRRDHIAHQDHGREIVAAEMGKLGLPYLLGGSIPGPTDCSGLTLWSHGLQGVLLPHNAAQQHDLFGSRSGFVEITRAQVKVGDLIFFHGDDHVAVYMGDHNGIESVVDTEPHDAVAPAGWPTATLGIGVRPRPMTGNYYCAWQYANGVGRIVAINGEP